MSEKFEEQVHGTKEIIARAHDVELAMNKFLDRVKEEGRYAESRGDDLIPPADLAELVQSAQRMALALQLFVQELSSEVDLHDIYCGPAETPEAYDLLEGATSTLFVCGKMLRPAGRQLKEYAERITKAQELALAEVTRLEAHAKKVLDARKAEEEQR